MKSSWVDHEVLGNIQASIESRLASAGPVCQILDLLVECCRLAAVITCFFSFTDIWANALIPYRLSEMLWRKLNGSSASSAWKGRHNIQLWLRLTGSCVTILDQGHGDGLRQKWNALLGYFLKYYSQLPQDQLEGIDFERVLSDFIYCKNLVKKRNSIQAWAQLELALSGKVLRYSRAIYHLLPDDGRSVCYCPFS